MFFVDAVSGLHARRDQPVGSGDHAAPAIRPVSPSGGTLTAQEFIMQTRRVSLALLATLSASAALFIAQPAAAAQPRFDPYTQGAVDRTDPYTQGADRQADTYGYLSWKNDRFDPYTQGAAGKADPYTDGADRQADTHGYLSWNGDATYPKDAASRA